MPGKRYKTTSFCCSPQTRNWKQRRTRQRPTAPLQMRKSTAWKLRQDSQPSNTAFSETLTMNMVETQNVCQCVGTCHCHLRLFQRDIYHRYNWDTLCVLICWYLSQPSKIVSVGHLPQIWLKPTICVDVWALVSHTRLFQWDIYHMYGWNPPCVFMRGHLSQSSKIVSVGHLPQIWLKPLCVLICGHLSVIYDCFSGTLYHGYG